MTLWDTELKVSRHSVPKPLTTHQTLVHCYNKVGCTFEDFTDLML